MYLAVGWFFFLNILFFGSKGISETIISLFRLFSEEHRAAFKKPIKFFKDVMV